MIKQFENIYNEYIESKAQYLKAAESMWAKRATEHPTIYTDSIAGKECRYCKSRAHLLSWLEKNAGELLQCLTTQKNEQSLKSTVNPKK